VLLVLGGLGFLITSVTNFVSPVLGDRLASLLLPIVLLAEGSLAPSLLVKAVDCQQWQLTTARSSTLTPSAR